MPLTRAVTIDEEASILSRVYSDLDKYRRFYSTTEVNEKDQETILIQFVAPKLFLFEEYRFTLLKNSETRELEPEYYYRPDYLSYNEYGTINLWAMILFINDIPTVEDFISKTVKVPSKQSILSLTKAATERQALKEIVKLHELEAKATPPLYARKKSIPENLIPDPDTPLFTPSDMYFARDVFTLDLVNVRNRYVDLTYEPVSESVNLNIVDSPNYLKGKHYDIIKGNKGYNRLTWDPRKISSGIGLVDVLVEGTQFEVSYAKRIKI